MHQRQGNQETPLSVFISYAHEDEALRQKLETYLSLLRRQSLISEWHDREILPGAEWGREIDEHLEVASIILLLISADFVASDYCYDKEMKRALERHKHGEARVIPIIMRPCDWHTSPFASLQSLPRDGKAVTTWQNPDEAFLAIAQGLRRVIEQQQMPLCPLPEMERKNRMCLIKRVRTTWIEGLLEHSLHEAVRLELHLEERPDALANPWRLQVQDLNRAPESLPTSTSIVQVYDEAEGELLILGEPGAGKTTLLLELARELLERAKQEEHHRLPVVFNLSSWAQGQLLLRAWLVEELATKYQVPRKIGQAWIDTDQVIPLLDDLDEVAEDARPGCVQAINTYYQQCLERGPVPFVVCCRSQEYMALPTRVTLHQAVSIQPLTHEQIELFVWSAGGQLETLRHALHNDSELYELARRPLMLSIFTLAYQGAVLEDLPTEGPREAQQQQVFATYLQRMLARRGVSKLFSREQALHWLTFLAAQMQQHHQTVFYLEHLQADWLGGWYRRLLYRLTVGLVFGLVLGLLAGPLDGLYLGLTVRLGNGLLIGLGNGLLIGLGNGLLIGLGFGLGRIQPREVLTRSWRGTKRSIIGGLAVWLVIWLAVWLGTWLIQGLPFGLGGGLVYGLVYGLAFGLASGFSANQLDNRSRLTPNQGIWRSASNGLILGLVGGLILGLVGGLIQELVFRLVNGLLIGLLIGLGFGLDFGVFFGLGAFLQHFTLRFRLWRAGHLPWNLVAFLEEAADRLLLRKVGGGYIFIHRLLLDYFASLEKKES